MNESKKKAFIILPFSMYQVLFLNIDKIIDEKKYEIILPNNYYRFCRSSNISDTLSKADIMPYYIASEASVNDDSLGTNSKRENIFKKASEKYIENLLRSKLVFSKSSIDTADYILRLSDYNFRISDEEKKELKDECNYAINKGKYAINIDLSYLQNQSSFLFDEDFVLKNSTAFISPIALYPVVREVLEYLCINQKKTPYEFNFYIKELLNRLPHTSISNIEEFNRMIKSYSFIERLTISDDIIITKQRFDFDRKLIDQNKMIVAFYDSKTNDEVFKKTLAYASRMGKLFLIIDINHLFKYYQESLQTKMKRYDN
ncbi:MAG: hypothetical protein PHE54_05055 [Bacilli bacterium]|nr:hypothetical protein [Bacilli bacterium]